MHIPEGYGAAALVFEGDGLPHGAVMTFGFDNNPSNFSAYDCANALQEDFVTACMPDINQDTTLARCVVKLGPNATGAVAEVVVNEQGGASGAGASPNVALLIRKTTDLGGRHGRGRMYQPGAIESAIFSDGTVNPANITTYQTNYDNFLAACTASQLPMVVLHAGATPQPTTVQSLIVDLRVATQRRRLRG